MNIALKNCTDEELRKFCNGVNDDSTCIDAAEHLRSYKQIKKMRRNELLETAKQFRAWGHKLSSYIDVKFITTRVKLDKAGGGTT